MGQDLRLRPHLTTTPHFWSRGERLPHVVIRLYPGKTEEQKKELTDAIVNDFVNILKNKEEVVTVAIEEVEKEEWAEKVYKPLIEDNWDKLYKKPGYKP